MASIAQIRAATKATLEAALLGVTVYSTVPGTAVGVCVVMQPAEDAADYNVAMGRGTDTYQFDLLVLVPHADLQGGQDVLDEYVTGAGPKSIREVVWNNRSLGLANTDAHITTMGGYGADHSLGTTQYIGATLRMVVHTKGTE